MLTAAPAQVHAPDPGHPSSEEVLGQLSRLVSSRELRESHQLQAFLDFVVRETLAGRQDGLKEYTLGCSVFGRRQDYDPRHDGIVRVQATALRKRLEHYYAQDGAADAVVIELPRGAYVPTFRYALKVEPDAPPAPAEPAAAPSSGASALGYAAMFALGCALTAIVWLAFSWSRPPESTRGFSVSKVTPSDFPQLWGAFFQPGARNVVAYGVPLFYNGDGLYFRDVLVNVPGRESDGRIVEFARKFNVMATPTDDTYTGVGEVEGTHLAANLFSSNGVPVRVANARSIGRSELAGHNLVVVSSLRFQTLLRDMNLPADFEFLPARPEAIRNRRPARGEKDVYTISSGAGVGTSYALVSLWPGITPGTRILHVGGVTTWSTQAAMEFLCQPDQLRRLAERFERDRTSGAHGAVSPYFQILLQVEGRENHSHKIDYLTHHYLPQSIDSKTP